MEEQESLKYKPWRKKIKMKEHKSKKSGIWKMAEEGIT